MRSNEELNPGEFVDLHVHVLPGLDDGPATLEDTVELLRVAHRKGTWTLVATPHLHHASFPEVAADSIRLVYRDTFQRLSELSASPEFDFLADLRLGMGAENFVSSEFFDDVERGEPITLNRSGYVLVEFSSYFSFDMIRAALVRVMDCNFRPVVAHIERYPSLLENPDGLRYLVQSGCVLQINAESLRGGRLSSARRRLIRLLRDEVVQLIASDGHGVTSRPPGLHDAASTLRKALGREDTVRILHRTPQSIVGDVPALRARVGD